MVASPSPRSPGSPAEDPVPHGRTARRVQWSHLPPPLRSAIERRLGTPVAEARSATTGFTPGFASVLVGEDGSTHFVKAAAAKAQRPFAEAYREEARKLAALPEAAPAPRLLWTIDADWVVLGIEHVAARHPRRPWTLPDLEASLRMLRDMAATLTPVPAGLDLDTFVADLADLPGCWDRLDPARLPGGEQHAAKAAALAARLPEWGVGETVVHTDVRDDNLLLADDGRVLLCDWNWPAAGPAWVDALTLLIGPRGDGLDVDAVLAADPLLAAVPPNDIDGLLAMLVGYFLTSAAQPVPPTSPHLRDAQRWQGEVCWSWLAQRRGWS